MRGRITLFRYLVRLFIITAAIIIAACIPWPTLATWVPPQVIPSSVQKQLDTYVKRYIDWYEAKYCKREPGNTCRGTEYREARRFSSGDIDGDGKEDIAVLYTLESFCCGNNYQFYLAVFLKRGEEFKLAASEKVGGKGEREVEFNNIKGGKILLNTKDYHPDDAMCCPSIKGRTTYSFKNGKLIENDRIGESR